MDKDSPTSTNNAEERYLVISADTHAGNHLLGYRPYLEQEWLDEFDAWAANAVGRWDVLEEQDEANRCRCESDLRLNVLEADGIAAEVFFPDTLPPFFPSSAVFANQPRERADYERRVAGIRAHNRWAVDFCNEVPGRRKAPVQIFLFDVDDALADIKWGHENGLAGVLMPAIAPNHPLDGLWSQRYDPIWRLCEELNMPVVQHVGAGTPDLGFDPAEGAALMYEVFFYARRSFYHMAFGGVFDRFPDLKLVMTEEGLAWSVDELEKLDHYYRNVIENPEVDQAKFCYAALSGLSKSPSGYFHSNCWIGASALPPSEVGALEVVNHDRVMWGSDYPHPEGTTPFTTAALRASMANFPPELCRRLLSENAAALYGFDLNVLAPVAQRIGPLVSEVHTPLDAYPEGSLLPIYMGNLHPRDGEQTGFSGQVRAIVGAGA